MRRLKNLQIGGINSLGELGIFEVDQLVKVGDEVIWEIQYIQDWQLFDPNLQCRLIFDFGLAKSCKDLVQLSEEETFIYHMEQ